MEEIDADHQRAFDLLTELAQAEGGEFAEDLESLLRNGPSCMNLQPLEYMYTYDEMSQLCEKHGRHEEAEWLTGFIRRKIEEAVWSGIPQALPLRMRDGSPIE